MCVLVVGNVDTDIVDLRQPNIRSLWITSGCADGHRVQMYVSIRNTEGVMAILMISRSRGGHIVIMFWKLLGALSISAYSDGH